MKKNSIRKVSMICLLGVAASLTFFGCQSTKNDTRKEEQTTRPSDEDVIALEPDENSYIAGNTESYDVYDSENFENNSKKNSSGILSFFSKSKYFEYDEASVFTQTALGSLKQYPAALIYNQKTQKFGFGSVYLAAYYYFQMDNEGRKKFSDAVNNYISDFSEKRLKRDLKKSTKVYGKINCYLNWGTVKSSTPNNGSGEAYLGYKFKDKSPYFTISVPAVYNNYSEITDTVSRESLSLTYYMTKAQALQLAALLSDESTDTVLQGYLQDNFTETFSSDDY